MKKRLLKKTSGVTLMEVTLAVAIFAVAIAMSAQALISFYAALDVQEQRVEAMQAARAVLAEVRQIRGDYQLPDEEYDWAGLLGWFSTQQEAEWAGFVRNQPGMTYLPDHALDVVLLNMNGEAAQPGDDPIEVQVRSSWTDLRGRTASVSVVGMFSER